MQFLKITPNMTLLELRNIVGSRDLDSILATNSLVRTPNIGQALNQLCQNAINNTQTVSYQRRMTLLNTFTDDADIFETVSLLGENEWKVLSETGTLPGMLRIPSEITLPDSTIILGGKGTPVSDRIYNQAMNYLGNSESVDPVIYNEYTSVSGAQIGSGAGGNNPLQWFHIPWGMITLVSSLTGESKDLPVYPEELEDGRTATYETMPDMLYQYEPWQTYKSSGPRNNTYTFMMHRDMWSGDHRDGKCNDLIRFCQANCYPDYNGAAVNTSIVSLYVAGQCLIRGILTEVKTTWSGPIGLDGFYLVVSMSLTFTEVSDIPLNYSTVRRKGLIG